ncbi:bifunctional diguanylate cyclase/phosphodiesterase [Thalassotalea euphylliae]|uniref:GGDEF domain-containing protein n=1 Tax=Thalassotalea euphylliae TaxID=1655234 RepID=A0A3E0UGK8_9GAMM|nr:bifunctional diguanylate cyclase/phosphodiesterase [Thalassotalea euphylliae]REL35996.1 GGDEF domain-containing protein [Thalassotalea euphylliae]
MKSSAITKSGLESLIHSKNFRCFFQPIFDVHQSTAIGYEALVRSPFEPPTFNPAELFDKAFEFGLLAELEQCCRRIAIKQFVKLGLEGFLFLNASPLAIEQTKHKASSMPAMLRDYDFDPARIVIEITERYEATDENLLKTGLQRYRDLGFKIAIDDLGTGHSGLKQWSEVRPDIVKIDRYFISGCQHNIVKRELIRTIFELGKTTGVSVIAEGIENEDEYLLLRKLGMKYVQGYLLGKPQSEPETQLPKLLVEKPLQKDTTKPNAQFELSKLIQRIEPIFADISCKAVYSQFKAEPNLKSIAVVDDMQLPMGMVYRDELTDLLSSDYGHALYDKQPIAKVMRPVSLMVDEHSNLDDVSKFITDHSEFDLHPEFIVTTQGKYAGLASVRSILKMMTEEKIMHAQQANPLTMLPGNIVIERKVNQLISHKHDFQLAYFDLDNFKPFNDVYGYAAGDQVIKLVADVIVEYSNKHGNKHNQENFIGHVGGDDFVVVFQSGDALACCQEILLVFEKRIIQYFELEHVKQSGYFAVDRAGNYTLIPLLSLSCGIISPDIEVISSVHDVSVQASKAKKVAKEATRGEVITLRQGTNGQKPELGCINQANVAYLRN